MTQKPVKIGDLAYAQTSDLTILHPVTGEALGPWVIAGPGHPQVKAYQNRVKARERAEMEAWGKALDKAKKTGKPAPEHPHNSRTAEETLRLNAESLACRVVSGFPVELADGTVVEVNESTAIDLLADPNYGWLYVQVEAGVLDTGNFIKTSAKD